MTALAPSSTARYKFFYTNLSHQHTMQIRSAAAAAVVGAIFDNLLTQVTGAIASTTLDYVEYAPIGSDIFNPTVTGFEGNTYGISGHPASDVATFWSWVGRTTGGKRVRIFLFGMGGMGGDYRYVNGELASADNAQASLVAASPDLIAIDGLVPVWHAYTNAGVNRLWQKNLRP